jgi:hypothetical protein
VEDSQYSHGVASMKVCDHIGKSGDYQLAGAVDAPGASEAWMIREHPDVPDDLEHSFDGGTWVVSTDVFLDRVEVAASGVRPL